MTEDQTNRLLERLRRTKTQYRTYGMFGGVAVQDESETREVLVNPDGPAAAEEIKRLKAELHRATMELMEAQTQRLRQGRCW